MSASSLLRNIYGCRTSTDTLHTGGQRNWRSPDSQMRTRTPSLRMAVLCACVQSFLRPFSLIQRFVQVPGHLARYTCHASGLGGCSVSATAAAVRCHLDRVPGPTTSAPRACVRSDPASPPCLGTTLCRANPRVQPRRGDVSMRGRAGQPQGTVHRIADVCSVVSSVRQWRRRHDITCLNVDFILFFRSSSRQ